MDGAVTDRLAAINLVKRFPGVVALKGVSFSLRPGEIHALCGENGAGKSTLIKILSGLHPAGSYEGDVRVDGTLAALRTTRDAEAVGIAVIHQELALVPELTVAENIYLATEPRTFLGLIDSQLMVRNADALLQRLKHSIDPNVPVRSLGIGHRQIVEIAKAIGKRSRILILDEPTAALTDREVQALLDILRDLRREGIAIVYISHKLEEVLAVADRITVLRDGQSVATLDAATTSRGQIIRHMIGREIDELFPRRSADAARRSTAPPLLSVRNLTVADKRHGPPILRDISFDVRAGEVLGIGGLMGAGRTELLMHVFAGVGHRAGGTVLLAGRPLVNNTPSESIGRGLVLVSEDRKRYGLVLDKAVGFNLSLSSLGRMTRNGLVDAHRESATSTAYVDSLRIKALGLDTITNTLSGGNQQKIVLGKAMMTEPNVVLLDEPTRGIDVGAKLEVYALVNRLTEQGKAVVLVSSELPELMGMSDRIVMIANGALGGTFDRSEATQELLLAAAMGQECAMEGAVR
jgi:D-xylose transport system ATP-binding protein